MLLCSREAAAIDPDRVEWSRDWPRVRLVEGLSAADLLQGGHHPTVCHLTVADLLNEWIHHDRNHVRQILANVQAYVWPHMGNSQRFSAG